MDKHRFQLMLPIELWERIKALAERSRRPITQEIILAVEQYIEDIELDELDAELAGTAREEGGALTLAQWMVKDAREHPEEVDWPDLVAAIWPNDPQIQRLALESLKAQGLIKE